MNTSAFDWLCLELPGPQTSVGAGLARADYARLIREAQAMGCRQVRFSGDDALLSPMLLRLLNVASLSDFENIEVFAPISAVSNSLLDGLKVCGAQLALPFLSHLPAIHDDLVGCEGDWADTLRGLERSLVEGVPVRAVIYRQLHDFKSDWKNGGQKDRQCDAQNLVRTCSFLHNQGVDSVCVSDTDGACAGLQGVAAKVVQPHGLVRRRLLFAEDARAVMRPVAVHSMAPDCSVHWVKAS
ncbi:MAG: hypothetical protein AAF529_00635 [Pseudomonadota bacterium]